MLRKKITVIILAAGQGKRMNSKQLPKVLLPFKGKPIIENLIEAVKGNGITDKIVVVVGQQAEQVKKALGNNYLYVYQKEPLGTAHAVACCQKKLENKTENIMVLYGDHPLLTAKSITKIIKTHLKSDSILSMATVKITDFNDWRKTFFEWGRIVRDKKGRLKESREMKDASEEHKRIKEVNPSFYCFKADWLWENLTMIKNHNAAKEYYLTDLIKLAVNQNKKISLVNINPKEAYGINTVEQLNQALRL